MVREMLAAPKIELLEVTRTLAYLHRYPYLRPVTLGEGSLDLANDIPSRDKVLLAAAAKLVARNNTPPDIMRLVLSKVHLCHPPVVVLAYPLLSNLPSLFDNYTRAQIYRWYGEIRRVEQQLPMLSIKGIDAKIEWLDDLHEYLNKRLRVPMFYLSDYYQMRGTLSVAIQRIEKHRQVLI